MQVKNIVRKAVVLGSAAGFVGMTMAGALAYDLSTYPAKFIVDGKFDGKIVVGEKASTSDVLGSIDIAASLQGASVTKKPVTVGGGATTTTLSGDVKQIGTGSDKLELREAIGKVTDTLTSTDLGALKGGKLTTAEGSTDYSQYLRFNSNIDSTGAVGVGNQLQDFGVDYTDNRDSKMGDWLVMEQTDKPVFEWQVQFSQGLKSKVDSSGRMRDIEDRTLNILGTDFSVVKATVTTAGVVDLVFMGGSVPDTLREGETKTYTINGVDYEVTLVFVSDPNSGGTPEVKLSVNGEITKALARSDTDTLSGGLQIGIRDILVNAREGVASFYLGADKIEFGPASSSTDAFQTGKVQINNQNINQAQLAVRGDFYAGTTDKFEVTSIKYRLKMDASSGSDVYIAKGHGLRENLRYPQGLISPTMDIRYEGLTEPTMTNLAFANRGNDQYNLQFTNLQNAAYDIYLVSNRNSVFKFGSDKDDLVFVEAASPNTPNIGLNDYFVTTDERSDPDKSVTNVLRYEDVDTTNKILYFTDTASGGQRRDVTFTMNTTNSVGSGDLVVGGHTFKVWVENGNTSTGSHRIAVDQNADGTFDSSATWFTVLGGGILSLTSITNGTGNTSTDFKIFDGNGLNISTVTNFASASTVAWSLRTRNTNFDTSGNGDEYINWTVSPTVVGTNPQVTMNVGESGISGPLTTQSSALKFKLFRLTTDRDDSQNYKGMSDYGVSILKYVPNSGNNPTTLTLGYPAMQRLAQVFVVGGTTTSSTSTSGSTTDVVNPIAVGLAVLDKDAPAVGSENLIVVGGPCANTVAAALLDNPAVCGEGFEAGKAMIKTFEKSGKVAILVAGYESTETLGASRVLAAYKDYALKGTEVEVVVADLNSIKVQAK